MAEFCTCGSIIIGGNCTNKNCSNRSTVKPGATKATASKAGSSAKKEPKTTRTRKASKVITYNLYDKERLEENIE